MVDDLQTLLTASLRRILWEAAAVAHAIGAPPPPIDNHGLVVDLLVTSLPMKDKPALQVESARALMEVFERLNMVQQLTVQDKISTALLESFLSAKRVDDDDNDEPPGAMVGDWLREVVNGESDVRRNLILGPVVRGIALGDDKPSEQMKHVRYLCSILRIEPDPPVLKVIETGIVPIIVGFLHKDDQPLLQRESAAFLAQLLKVGCDNDAVLVVNANGIPALVRLLQESPSTQVKEGAAWALKGIASRNGRHRDGILRDGVVPPLVDMAIHNADGSRARRAATAALASMFTQWPSNPPEAHSNDDASPAQRAAYFDAISHPWTALPLDSLRPVMTAMVEVIKGNDEETLLLACEGLNCMSGMYERNLLDEDLGAELCPRLVELLGRHTNPKIHEEIVWTMSNIFANESTIVQLILDHGLFSALHHATSSPTSHWRVKWATCAALTNLIGGNQGRIQEVIDAGLIPALMECLGISEMDAHIDALELVTCIADGGTYRQMQSMVDAGCIPSLCALLTLNEDDSTSTSSALAALESILAGGKSAVGADNPMVALIASPATGGPQKIREIQQHHPREYVREEAARLLVEYFPIEEDG